MNRNPEQTVRLARELTAEIQRRVADRRFWRLLSASAEEMPRGGHDAR